MNQPVPGIYTAIIPSPPASDITWNPITDADAPPGFFRNSDEQKKCLTSTASETIANNVSPTCAGANIKLNP